MTRPTVIILVTAATVVAGCGSDSDPPKHFDEYPKALQREYLSENLVSAYCYEKAGGFRRAIQHQGQVQSCIDHVAAADVAGLSTPAARRAWRVVVEDLRHYDDAIDVCTDPELPVDVDCPDPLFPD